MKKALQVFLPFLLLLFLAACGGGGQSTEPPAASNNTATEVETVEEAAPPTEEAMDEPEAEPTVAEAPAEEEAAAEETTADETAAEAPAEANEETAAGFGDRPMSGTDPETGLVINPERVNPGDTVIVRGTIISMNLTPTTSPEFLIESPDGVKYRIRSQDLANTFYEDGAEIQPFQFQIGMLAQATVTQKPDAAITDLPTSEDLTLIHNGE